MIFGTLSFPDSVQRMHRTKAGQLVNVDADPAALGLLKPPHTVAEALPLVGRLPCLLDSLAYNYVLSIDVARYWALPHPRLPLPMYCSYIPTLPKHKRQRAYVNQHAIGWSCTQYNGRWSLMRYALQDLCTAVTEISSFFISPQKWKVHVGYVGITA